MNTTVRARAPQGSYWNLNRETTLNWLALGMLLAAWNASDGEPASKAPGKPEALRGYSQVSVRAANRAAVTMHEE
jgi:hypothetical protein